MSKASKKYIVFLLSVCIFLGLIKIFNVPQVVMKKIYPMGYSQYVTKYAKEYDVDDLLVYAVIKAESNFKANVVSKKSAKGLMQVMDKTAEEVAARAMSDAAFDINMLFDAETNIKIGTKYLAELLDKYNRKLLFSSCSVQCGKWYCR